MKKTLIILVLIITGFLFQNCKETTNQKSLTKTVNFTKEGELRLKKSTSDSLIKTLDLEFAESDYETQTGLMYRQSMEDQQAMLFIFKDEQPRSFYMKNTEFALDIIYINSDKKIVSIQKNAKPYDKSSLSSNAPAMYVLEINGGLSDFWGLEIGDLIEW